MSSWREGSNIEHMFKDQKKLPLCYFKFVFVEHVFKMKILQDWNDELKDTESTAFKALSVRLETEVKTINNVFYLYTSIV